MSKIKKFRIDAWKSLFGLEKPNLKYFDQVSEEVLNEQHVKYMEMMAFKNEQILEKVDDKYHQNIV